MPRLLIFLLFTSFVACSNQAKQNTIVLNYSDFGPQVIASEVIGMEWWQWQTHGESRPTAYDIKIVVFSDISLEVVKGLYPVEPSNERDYRYLKYENAIGFLETKIEDNVMEDVTKKLKLTRTKLIGKFSNQE